MRNKHYFLNISIKLFVNFPNLFDTLTEHNTKSNKIIN